MNIVPLDPDNVRDFATWWQLLPQHMQEPVSVLVAYIGKEGGVFYHPFNLDRDSMTLLVAYLSDYASQIRNGDREL